MFESDTSLSLRHAGSHSWDHDTIVSKNVKEELRLFPYKLQMSQRLDENYEQNRLNLAVRCRKSWETMIDILNI